MGDFLPPAQWYATLSSSLVTAGVVIRDQAGRVLLVKPNYRPTWNIPGGILEEGEPPHLACVREVAEELGLDVDLGRLLVVDWVRPNHQRKAFLGFLFDGGVIDADTPIRLQRDELDGHRFAARGELRAALTRNTADRVEAALDALADGSTAYLYEGQPVGRVPARPAA